MRGSGEEEEEDNPQRALRFKTKSYERTLMPLRCGREREVLLFATGKKWRRREEEG